MRRFMIAALAAATALSVFACSGGYGGSSPTVPTASSGSSAPPADAVVINVVGINGAQSFSPNPATVPTGRLVVWHNIDSVTHRVMFNDGEVDSGNIAPGAYSAPTGLAAPGPYHCSIHPPMVGTVVGQ
jgi:plastocyanin